MRRVVSRSSCAVVMLSASIASAAPSHRELGAEHYAKTEYAAAAAEFRLCIADEHEPDCSFALAQTLRVLGDCKGAIGAYQQFLDTQPSGAEGQAARDAITACGGTPHTRTATPPPHVDEPIAAPPPVVHETKRRDGLAIAAFSLGGAAAIGGATFLWLSARARDDAKQLGDGSGTLADFQARLDDAHRDRWIGGIALGVGGALIIAGAVKLLTHDGGASTTATAVLLPISDGVMVAGSTRF